MNLTRRDGSAKAVVFVIVAIVVALLSSSGYAIDLTSMTDAVVKQNLDKTNKSIMSNLHAVQACLDSQSDSPDCLARWSAQKRAFALAKVYKQELLRRDELRQEADRIESDKREAQKRAQEDADKARLRAERIEAERIEAEQRSARDRVSQTPERVVRDYAVAVPGPSSAPPVSHAGSDLAFDTIEILLIIAIFMFILFYVVASLFRPSSSPAKAPASSNIAHDDFDPDIFITSPLVPYGGDGEIYGKNFMCLRSLYSKTEGRVIVTNLIVSNKRHLSEFAGWNKARLDTQEMLEFSHMKSEKEGGYVRVCHVASGTFAYEEQFSVVIPMSVLTDREQTGFTVKFYASNSDTLLISVSSNLIAMQLEAFRQANDVYKTRMITTQVATA